jgi:hypothetical protein
MRSRPCTPCLWSCRRTLDGLTGRLWRSWPAELHGSRPAPRDASSAPAARLGRPRRDQGPATSGSLKCKRNVHSPGFQLLPPQTATHSDRITKLITIATHLDLAGLLGSMKATKRPSSPVNASDPTAIAYGGFSRRWRPGSSRRSPFPLRSRDGRRCGRDPRSRPAGWRRMMRKSRHPRAGAIRNHIARSRQGDSQLRRGAYS